MKLVTQCFLFVAVLCWSGSVIAQDTLPVITKHLPTVAQVKDGQLLTLSVEATGPNLRYDWYENGVLVRGARSPSITTSRLRVFDSGTQYSVKVYNGAGQVFSGPTTLSVLPLAPVIKRQPFGRRVPDGTRVSFSLSVISRDAELTYRWQRAESIEGPWVDLPNSNVKRYFITANYQTDHLSLWRCIVSNAGGSVTSNAATLKVQEPRVRPHSVSGVVTFNGAPMSKVRVRVSPMRGNTTKSDGKYAIRGLFRGSYLITPDKLGYSFTPLSGNGRVVIGNEDITNYNFAAICAPNFILKGSECRYNVRAIPPIDVKATDGTSRNRSRITWGRISFPGIPRRDVPKLSYRVYRSNNLGERGSLIGETRATSFADTTGEAGRVYYYGVTSVMDGVESSLSAQDAGSKPAVETAPAAVAPLSNNLNSYGVTVIAVSRSTPHVSSIELYNRGDESVAFAVRIFDAGERLLSSESVTVGAGQSVALNSGAQFGAVDYAVEVTPDDVNAPYRIVLK